MSRRSKHSLGADGLPLLEINEEAIQKLPFYSVHAQNEVGLRDQRCKCSDYMGEIGPILRVVCARLRKLAAPNNQKDSSHGIPAFTSMHRRGTVITDSKGSISFAPML